MRIRRFLHMLLVVIACPLLWQIVAIWRRPLEAHPPPTPQRSEEDTPPPPVRAPSPQTGKRYAGIIADKDLFSLTRSRAIKETAPAATVPPPSHLKLVGVMLATGGKAEAFFADATQGGKVVHLTKGEALGTYKLVNVAPLQATLTMGSNGDEVTLPLLVLDSNTASQAPQTPQSGPGRSGATPVAEAAPPDEAQAIRQNIQQLQQRLRQIRQQAASDNPDGAEDDTSNDEEG